MPSKNIIHYDITEIDKLNADINLIWGERSNGKSYQVKHKKAVCKYLETGRRFILVRRYQKEVTSDKIERYFSDIDISSLTKGKYNCITMYRRELFLSVFNIETGKTIRYDKIGYVVVLQHEQHYAGASYLDVDDIIFEEFMSRSVYLRGESSKLMNFYCTVDRKRATTKLWLVGNTISRVCPYIEDWGLHKIMSSMKQGDIKTKTINSAEDDVVTIAIEHCKSTGVSSHTIGSHSKMLNDGSWQTDEQPQLPKSRNAYKTLYKIGFQYKSFKYIAEYIQDMDDTSNICWFIKPYYGDYNGKILVFSDIIRVERNWQRNIYNISINNTRMQRVLNTFREDKIFYSDDLTGTDFKQCIDFEIRR